MSRPARVTDGDEYIDRPADDRALEASLDHVAAVNRWLGGTRALLRSLLPLLPAAGPVSILDAGTGTGAIPLALARLARARRREFHIVATDLHPQTIRLAARRARHEPRVHVCHADVLRMPFPDRAFDFTLLTLTLHHLADPDQAIALRELARVTRRAVLIGELERTWPHYLGAKLLAATIWRGNALTRHDAPLSVLRGFTPGELLERATAAGLAPARLVRRFFYRLVLILDLAAQDPPGAPSRTIAGSPWEER